MSRTAGYVEAHKEVLSIAHEVAALLSPVNAKSHSTGIRSLLSLLAGKLKLHLALEDNSLYPELLQQSNAATRKMAESFQTEMGGIKGQFEAYMTKWSTAQRIELEPLVFVQETSLLLKALKRRIDREDKELYPLVERLGT